MRIRGHKPWHVLGFIFDEIANTAFEAAAWCWHR